VQVADRWHLLKNLGDVLEPMLTREHRHLHEVAAQVREERPPSRQPNENSRASSRSTGIDGDDGWNALRRCKHSQRRDTPSLPSLAPPDWHRIRSGSSFTLRRSRNRPSANLGHPVFLPMRCICASGGTKGD
jgi:hypothetical protein